MILGVEVFMKVFSVVGLVMLSLGVVGVVMSTMTGSVVFVWFCRLYWSSMCCCLSI